MTTLEMLDAIEGRIARLRAALEDAETRLRAIGEALAPAPAKPRKRSSETSSQTVGKRVALGRGLAQLRKTSSPHRDNSPYWSAGR